MKKLSLQTHYRQPETILRKNGLRVTQPRLTILHVLENSKDHPTAEELFARARALDSLDHTISLATVYRTLSALEECQIIHRNSFEGGSARYELNNQIHHDHLIDVDTGDVIEFCSDKIEHLQQEIAQELGYEVIHHRLELYAQKKK